MSVVIKLENVSKRYRLGLIGTNTLKGDLQRWWYNMRGLPDPTLMIGQENNLNIKAKAKGLSTSTSTSTSDDIIWALKDINFEVKQGEVLGIIGKNGAGKSTLLKLLSRVTAPTMGNIKVKGRIASLLEVGTGFHPELTGRENIFLNGAILGMTKTEIRNKFDEIVDFAGVTKYIDTPVKRYSSGMFVRLAFAVAAHLEPEILIVDEVLAVGDAEFQKKAIGKMQDVSRNNGRTVLFVSHNMEAVKNLCTSGIVLNNGSIDYRGSSVDIVTYYLSDYYKEHTIQSWSQSDAPESNGIKFISGRLIKDTNKASLETGDSFFLEFVFLNTNQIIAQYDITFFLFDEMDNVVFVGSTAFIEPDNERKTGQGTYKAVCRIPAGLINEGSYRVSRILFVQNKGFILYEHSDLLFFEVNRPVTNYLGWQGAKEGIVKPQLKWEYYIDTKKIV